MAERPEMLRAPYSAYAYRDMPGEDRELTHVGPGTPCGEYLRRYWQPVAVASELKDLPVRIRIMGEDLVIFRDFGGRIGLLQARCSHRGTSLEFGLVSERGLRCCYHGWLYDVDGRILDTPGEPKDSKLKERLFHGAYPVHEYQGFVFAYMGPPDLKPPFHTYTEHQPRGYWVSRPRRDIVPCNWLQMKENQMDPVHTAFLHTIVSGSQLTEEFGHVGQLDWILTPIGMAYIHTRRVGDNVWVRMAESILPNMNQYPATWETGRKPGACMIPEGTLWSVPIDDTRTMNMGYTRYPEGMPEFRDSTEKVVDLVQRKYEDMQRKPGDYEAQVGQGPITVHALEHLGTTDRGVITFRKLIREGIHAVANGRDPKGIIRGASAHVPTYTNNTLVHIPPAPTEDEDAQLLLKTGREVARRYVPPSGD